MNAYGCVEKFSGTSFACAYVSGIVATFMSEQGCTPARAKKLLILNAERGKIGLSPLNGPDLVANNGLREGKMYEGFGLVKVKRRLMA